MLHLDYCGNLQCSTSNGGALDEVGEAIAQRSNGIFVTTGREASSASGAFDAYFFQVGETNCSSTTVSRILRGDETDIFQDLVLWEVGEDIWTGHAGSTTSFLDEGGVQNGWLVKTTGTKIDWYASLGTNVADRFEGIIRDDDYFVVAGGTLWENGANDDLNVLAYKIDTSDGSAVVESYYYGDTYDDYVWDIELIDGSDGYVVTGYTTNALSSTSGRDILFMRLHTDLTVRWAIAYGSTDGDEEGLEIINAQLDLCDNYAAFAITGYTDGFSAAGDDAFIMAIDTIGFSDPKHHSPCATLVRYTADGADGNERGYSLKLFNGHDAVIMAGYTDSWGAGGRDVYVVRAYKDLTSNCSNEVEAPDFEILDWDELLVEAVDDGGTYTNGVNFKSPTTVVDSICDCH